MSKRKRTSEVEKWVKEVSPCYFPFPSAKKSVPTAK
ncbi:hypothetical protein N784_14445 [Pontibacillus litoralis JSM 072002]|uniref:Uncharacterized protein n=1 Tax=Pontibacillus litoralis JSM 072002 TaxID=1385512 RepID=A0A0A5FZL5_9BACI|nr:hypothetical protein N784_14445 [Pontibacillus litoralis JSM 072002]